MVEGTIYLLRYSIFWNAFAVIFLIYDDWILCNLRVIFFKAWLSIFKFGSTFIIKRSTVINVCAFFFSLIAEKTTFDVSLSQRWGTPLEFGHRHLTIFDKFSNEMKQVASISKFNFWQRVSKARWNWYPPGGLLCFCGAIKKGLIDKKLHGIITTYSKRSLFNSITFR